jgi:hypothetical protein
MRVQMNHEGCLRQAFDLENPPAQIPLENLQTVLVVSVQYRRWSQTIRQLQFVLPFPWLL